MVPEHKSSGALHGMLLLAALGLVVLAGGPLLWPWYLLLPLLIYGGVVIAVPALRRTAPWPAVGRVGGWPLVYSLVLTLGASAALVAFDVFARPDVSELAERLPVRTLWHPLLAGVVFSIVNAILEELLFRGVLWEAVAREWNAGTALAVSATVFGLGHLHGYPPGVLGAVLAGLYGLALGVLRWWTGGLALPVACHICADATIFGLLVCADPERTSVG
jgi:uncharacterized protein